MSPQITIAGSSAELLDLPWSRPLAEWPEDRLAALPRGLSRHVVRFIRLEGGVLAAKEIGDLLARREYDLLRRLRTIGLPVVEPVGVVRGRIGDDGEPLDPVLLTRHLRFSLPYRALFSHDLRPGMADRLVGALALLLVRLHLSGFYWGDVSLSNTLFRRDAGQFAAYLVDAETGELHQELSRGQRDYDLDLARTNITAELFDLEAGGFLEEAVDPIALGESLVESYAGLWAELTAVESFDPAERWRLHARIERLNEIGFDVDEMAVSAGSESLEIQPKVVDAGHHSRRLLRLNGLDVEENQARRLLNDLDAFRLGEAPDDDEQQVAYRWLRECFDLVVRAVPSSLRGKLEAAELYHQVLERRWYLSEAAGRDVGLAAALHDFVSTVLVDLPDEDAVLGFAPEAVAD
jgi:hypothetical protein